MRLRIPKDLELLEDRMIRGPIGCQNHRPSAFGLSFGGLDLPIKHRKRYQLHTEVSRYSLHAVRCIGSSCSFITLHKEVQEAKNLCGHAPIARLRPGVHQLATHLVAIRFESFEGRRESEVSVLTARYCSAANIKTQCPGYDLTILYDLKFHPRPHSCHFWVWQAVFILT